MKQLKMDCPLLSSFKKKVQKPLDISNRRANVYISKRNKTQTKKEKRRKTMKHTNPYLRKFLRQIRWKPAHLAVFAGKLDYPHYHAFDRLMIRLIMRLTHGPTDPRAVIEFTDWQQVEAFGRRISAAA